MHRTKSFAGHASVKDAEQGIAEVVVSAYGNVDHDGDVVLKGASAKQIAGEYGPIPKGMQDHQWAMSSAVAKTLDWWEEDDGLHIEAQYNLAKQVGREAFEDLKFYGDQMEFSVGYRIKDSERAPEADRSKGIKQYIKEWVIDEWSHVMLGANSNTHLVSLKAGARNSAADQAALQNIHDSTVVLGAACGEKHVEADDGEKSDAAFEVAVFGDDAKTYTAGTEPVSSPEPEQAEEVGVTARQRDEFRLLVASTLI